MHAHLQCGQAISLEHATYQSSMVRNACSSNVRFVTDPYQVFTCRARGSASPRLASGQGMPGAFSMIYSLSAPSPICSRGHPNAQSKLNNPTHQVWVRRHVLGIAIVESEAKEMEKLVASKSMPNASHRNTSSKSSVIRCDKQQMAPTAQPHDASRRVGLMSSQASNSCKQLTH